MCREVWNVYVRMCVHMYVCVGAYVWEEWCTKCVCVYVVCFIVAAVFISHLLKMLKRGMEVRGYYGQACWKSVR